MTKFAFKMVTRAVAFLVFGCLFASLGAGIFAVSFGWVDPYQIFPNLPQPPEIEAEVPGVNLGPRFDLPPLPEDLGPRESVPLRDMVEPRPLASMVPAPQQVTTAPPVVATNLGLAIVMALIFGVCVTILDNMINDEQVRIQAWLKAYGIDKLVPKVQSVLGWSASRAVKQGCFTLPLIVVILALYGVIFAFLERGTSIFSQDGVFLAATMAFTVGIVSFSGDILRRFFGRIWNTDSSFNLYPISLLIAVVTVGASRLFSISPGVVFGVPGGADVDIPPEKRERREVILAAATIITLGVLALVGWGISGLTLRLVNTPIEQRLAGLIDGPVNMVLNVSLLLFLVALETVFFESLPIAYSTGRTLFKKHKALWVAFFVPIAFAFNHTLLNPQSDFLTSFQTPNVRVLWLTIFGLAGVTAMLWFYFNVVDDILQEWVGLKKPREQRPPPPY
jgi:hypothetical protein